jgi:uncharacterized protein
VRTPSTRLTQNLLLASLLVLLASSAHSQSSQSIADLRSRAEKGDAQAQSALGDSYHKGDGVPKDDAEAVRWWTKAAEQGDIGGEINLGLAYHFGWV